MYLILEIVNMFICIVKFEHPPLRAPASNFLQVILQDHAPNILITFPPHHTLAPQIPRVTHQHHSYSTAHDIILHMTQLDTTHLYVTMWSRCAFNSQCQMFIEKRGILNVQSSFLLFLEHKFLWRRRCVSSYSHFLCHSLEACE